MDEISAEKALNIVRKVLFLAVYRTVKKIRI